MIISLATVDEDTTFEGVVAITPKELGADGDLLRQQRVIAGARAATLPRIRASTALNSRSSTSATSHSASALVLGVGGARGRGGLRGRRRRRAGLVGGMLRLRALPAVCVDDGFVRRTKARNRTARGKRRAGLGGLGGKG